MHSIIASSLRAPIIWLGISAAAAISISALASFSGSVFAAPSAPHPIEGRENCLLCHSATDRPAPVPPDHGSYSQDTCAGCHWSSAGPSPTATPSPLPTPANTANRDLMCLACHQNQNMSIELSSGETLPLYVDVAKINQSVHGRRLACTDCHPSMASTVYPHPKVRYDSRRAYTTTYYEACKRCHFANYTKTLDSVHFSALGAGDHNAPVCADCHGTHYITKPASPRGNDSQACGKCHTDVYNAYAESVHGKALIGEDNPDVPACTTCHGVHSIQGANSNSFRLASTQLCARCHEDKQLMAKYGLSASVLKTYFEDFHGRTVGFYQRQGSDQQPTEPLCVDCHGIHSIKSAKDPSSPVIQANLQATCQKCHKDASPNFPSAWLAHYEPSADKAPLVYYIRVYYWVLIPMMIGGLLLHIGLDLWRMARNR
ncbi:MAG: cytochrome c3 family protein [Chloroflexi bacterium]|nr:cytochrome c3 family protein [Chloroflexota bacterium]